MQELKYFFNEWMDNGKNAFLCSLIQFSFQVLVMQISTSFFTNILMQQLKKHIPHFESHFIYPYHDDCLKIYKYMKLNDEHTLQNSRVLLAFLDIASFLVQERPCFLTVWFDFLIDLDIWDFLRTRFTNEKKKLLVERSSFKDVCLS